MKPMLSATCGALGGLAYPLLASPKLDGVRALCLPGVGLVSRNLKPIPNRHVRRCLSDLCLTGLDGELILGDPASPSVFRDTASAVMSHDGEPPVKLHVFDMHGLSAGFSARLNYIGSLSGITQHPHVVLVPHVLIKREAQLVDYEQECLRQGYEGVMLRHPDGPYKQGRSTLREGWLMKLKRFNDGEAVVVDCEERLHNANAATTNALGYTERSSHKANMLGRGDLGALVVRAVNGPYEGMTFRIGTGFDDAERADLWTKKRAILGAVVKYKYFPTGSKEAPRFPVFLGFRPEGA